MATGSVKWYDPEKGYGFIERDNGGPDLFVHRSALGTQTVAEGDKVEFEDGVGLRGPAATQVTVLERGSSPAPARASSSRGGIEPSPDVSGLPITTGVVKRYDALKGFGFIRPDDGGDDVFVHRSAVGYAGLAEGDRVEFRLGIGAKGPRAEQVRVID